MLENVFPVCDYPDVTIVSGQGSYVQDHQGKHYLDLNSGQFCAAAGHSSTILRKALLESLDCIQDTHTGLLSTQALEGLSALGSISGFEKPHSILLSTGSEAIEFALRYAKHIKEKNGVVALDVGYHGITHGAAAYSMSRARVRPPLSDSFAVPAPRCKDFAQSEDYDFSSESAALEACLKANSDQIAAFIVEPVISGGGMYKLSLSYLERAISLCHAYNVYVIFDECQTGIGRLGRWYSYSDSLIRPDFVVTGKSLGLGLPVSAVTARGEAVDLDKVTLAHFSSHQNEAFSGTIAAHCIGWIEQENKPAAIKSLGQQFLAQLSDVKSAYCQSPRGEGFMLGFDLTEDAPSKDTIHLGNQFVRAGLKHGLLLQHCNYGRTIRILPNYNTTTEDFSEFVIRLEATFNELR